MPITRSQTIGSNFSQCSTNENERPQSLYSANIKSISSPYTSPLSLNEKRKISKAPKQKPRSGKNCLDSPDAKTKMRWSSSNDFSSPHLCKTRNVPLSTLPLRVVTTSKTLPVKPCVLNNRSKIQNNLALDLISPLQLELKKDEFFIERPPYRLTRPPEDDVGMKPVSKLREKVLEEHALPNRTVAGLAPFGDVPYTEEKFRTIAGSTANKRKQANDRFFRQKLPILGSKTSVSLIDDSSVTPSQPVRPVSRCESLHASKKKNNEGNLDKEQSCFSRQKRQDINSTRDVETFIRQLKFSLTNDRHDVKIGSLAKRPQLQPRVSSLSMDHSRDEGDRQTHCVESTYIFGSPRPLSKGRLNCKKASSKTLTPPTIIRRTSTEMGIPSIIPDLPSCMSYQEDQEDIKDQRVSKIDDDQRGDEEQIDIEDDGGFFLDPPPFIRYCSSSVDPKRIKTSPCTLDEMVDVLDDDFFGLGLLPSFEESERPF